MNDRCCLLPPPLLPRCCSFFKRCQNIPHLLLKAKVFGDNVFTWTFVLTSTWPGEFEVQKRWGGDCPNLFLFARVLKCCSAAGSDFPHVVLRVSLTETSRSHKCGDGVCLRGLLPLIPHINAAQVPNTRCRYGWDPNASHRGGHREKWGVTQLEGESPSHQ